MKKENRFEKVYSQGSISVVEVWVDKETGVNYIFRSESARLTKKICVPLVKRIKFTNYSKVHCFVSLLPNIF